LQPAPPTKENREVGGGGREVDLGDGAEGKERVRRRRLGVSGGGGQVKIRIRATSGRRACE